MNKTLIAALLCSASVVGVGAGSAFAGELTGNGVLKGVNDNASMCAYSGLNDNIQGQTERRTQTPKDAAPGSAAFGWEVAPGVILTCNKNGPVGG
jgi:hypothetical protein